MLAEQMADEHRQIALETYKDIAAGGEMLSSAYTGFIDEQKVVDLGCPGVPLHILATAGQAVAYGLGVETLFAVNDVVVHGFKGERVTVCYGETQRVFLNLARDEGTPAYSEALVFDSYDRLGNFTRWVHRYSKATGVIDMEGEKITAIPDADYLATFLELEMTGVTMAADLEDRDYQTKDAEMAADLARVRGLIASAPGEVDHPAQIIATAIIVGALPAPAVAVLHPRNAIEREVLAHVLSDSHTLVGGTLFPQQYGRQIKLQREMMREVARITRPQFERGTQVTLHPKEELSYSGLVEGARATVEGWWDELNGGKGWAETPVMAAMLYSARVVAAGLPKDNDVLYVKVPHSGTTLGHLVHISEVEA